ncbi:GIY-YIG nuclease family protein [Deinococcus maricopensis]|uniref:LuxR family transcriptional regulator n=1 Tax=Deinococcus maricopensis (strain DSM 21211 / LMG 22137 / NRRL B-23946 / LB-34) TaxID=709986 RepID=E8UAA4_DEIML|nr:GIY-YIG nuclease family protein [Deinococcus maricopensis]ADV67993.1 hypothetical protein Deima_2355 [Deinococcus maricopensis DSM 21211]
MNAPRAYKGFTPVMGIYAVRHAPSGRTLLGCSPHVQGMLNRTRFQLQLGAHPNAALQRDWNACADDLQFEVLDELTPDPARPAEYDYTDDLRELLALWHDRLNLAPHQRY